MKVTLASGKVSRDRKGRKGARLQIRTPDGEKWAGVYTLDTHGMTDEEIETRVETIRERHTAKSARFDGFRTLCAETFGVGDGLFRVADCRLVDIGQPGGDAELTIYAQQMNADGSHGERLKRPWFPIVVAVADIAQLPSDEEIRTMCASRITEMLGDQEENEQLLSRFRTLEATMREGGRK